MNAPSRAVRAPRLPPYGQDPGHPGAHALAQRLAQALPAHLHATAAAPWTASFHLVAWFAQGFEREGLPGVDEAVRTLARHHAVDLPDAHGRTPLDAVIVSAPDAWRADAVRRLLSAGADPARTVPPYDLSPASTPLILAVQFHAPAVVELLLAAGAPPYQATVPDRAVPTTALNEAVARSQAALVDRLIVAGAPVDAVDGRGLSPLLLACGATEPSLDVLNRLLVAGADVNARQPDGEPVAFAAGWAPAQEHREAVLRRLLTAGLDPNLRDTSTQDTLLARLCNASSPDLASVNALLDAGADARTANVFGNTPLHFATSQFTLDWPLIGRLVDAGGSLDHPNQDGQTPAGFLDEELVKLQERHAPEAGPQAMLLDHLKERAALYEAMRPLATGPNGPSSRDRRRL